jgi:hypothetical protein
MARDPGVLVGSSCRGVAVADCLVDPAQNNAMQWTRGHRHALWRARGPRAIDRTVLRHRASGFGHVVFLAPRIPLTDFSRTQAQAPLE